SSPSRGLRLVGDGTNRLFMALLPLWIRMHFRDDSDLPAASALSAGVTVSPCRYGAVTSVGVER
ncbi:MAG: hypothetical protein ACXWCC_01370, partial [Caldimonas sp.]